MIGLVTPLLRLAGQERSVEASPATSQPNSDVQSYHVIPLRFTHLLLQDFRIFFYQSSLLFSKISMSVFSFYRRLNRFNPTYLNCSQIIKFNLLLIARKIQGKRVTPREAPILPKFEGDWGVLETSNFQHLPSKEFPFR